jgi:hypothetical protein
VISFQYYTVLAIMEITQVSYSTLELQDNARSQAKSTTWIHIPDTLAYFPWPRTLNPHFEECKAESDAWIQSFKVFTPKAQIAFNKCDFSLLAALAYPRLDRG